MRSQHCDEFHFVRSSGLLSWLSIFVGDLMGTLTLQRRQWCLLLMLYLDTWVDGGCYFKAKLQLTADMVGWQPATQGVTHHTIPVERHPNESHSPLWAITAQANRAANLLFHTLQIRFNCWSINGNIPQKGENISVKSAWKHNSFSFILFSLQKDRNNWEEIVTSLQQCPFYSIYDTLQLLM